MEATNEITFVISNDTSGEEAQNIRLERSSSSSISVTSVAEDPLLQSTLRKVASDVNLDDITSGNKRLTEEDIEVEDCSLTQDEGLTLYTKCRDFFDQDAWAAVGHNTKDISNTTKDLVFPLYTEAEDEDFWLFYCPGQNVTTVHNARGSAKLKGYWLDCKTTSNKYSILEYVSEMKVKWIIKTDHGPLYYEQHLNVDANEEGFELLDLFEKCIRVTLQKYGVFKGSG